MSLKGFHILFITLSTLLCVGLAIWGGNHFVTVGNGTHLTLALLGAAGTLGLPIYGWWFLKKTRDVEIL
jgi:hypothetical protein